jgi:AraC family transcriptional regulator
MRAPTESPIPLSNVLMKHVPITPIRILDHREIPGSALTHFCQPANFEIQPHSHASAVITLVLAGGFHETVQDSKYHCIPGSILMKPASVQHKLKYSSCGVRCLLIETSCIDFPSVDLLNAKDLTHSIRKEFLTHDQSSEVVMAERIHHLASAHPQGVRAKPFKQPPSWLQTAKDFMNDRARDPIGLANIAEAAGVHPSHLSEVFHKIFRCTAGEYLRCLRLNWAMSEITNSHRPVVEIALEAGFYDQSHFYRFFKRHTGLNPIEMRKYALGMRA